jgi:hypothetical protein
LSILSGWAANIASFVGDVIIINLKIPSFRQTQKTGEEDITLRNQGKNGKS